MAITTINGIPVYRATLCSENCGMKKISLVDAPAVLTDFQAFADAEQPMRYAVQDEDRRLVYGVIMRANFPIYRYSKKTGEYYILYDADTIREMAEKYLSEGRQDNVNLQHEEGTDVDGVNLVQWFIKDTERGIAPAGFEEIEDGSLFGEFHITNDEVWAGVKDGTYKGFSLEGIFGREEVDAVVSTEKLSTKHNLLMTIMERVRGAIAAALETEFSEEIKAEAAAAPEQQQEQTYGSVATDKGVMRWDGDEALAVGNAVKMVAEDGSESAPADGVYTTESHEVEIAGGVVKEIRDKVDASAEEAPAEEAPAKEEEKPAQEEETEQKAGEQEAPGKFGEMVQRLAATFDDMYRAIYAAFAAAGLDAWIVEAGETFAVVELWNGEDWHYYRYALTFNEDKTEVTLGERVEVFPAFVTAEEKAEAESKYAAQDAELVALRAQVAELKSQPATKPAHDKFSNASKEEMQEEKHANLYRILSAK